jgi:outer membrane protein assembly factor BamB
VPADDYWTVALVGGVLIVANNTWTRGRGISTQDGRTLYALSAASLWLWRDCWVVMADDSLVLASATTGEILEKRAPLPLLPSDAGVARIEGDVVIYQAEKNTQVIAYDLSRQELLWKRPLRREIAARSGADEGTVVLRAVEPDLFVAHITNRVVAGCSLADGSILWDMAVPFQSPVVPYRDRVFVMLAQEGGRSSPRLVCLDAATGARVYDVDQPELSAMDLASYGTVYEDWIGFGTRGGLVGLFRLADGDLAWSYRDKVPLYLPVMADGRLYVSADDGSLLIFEPAT